MKLRKSNVPDYRQIPIRDMYGVSFTGYGKNRQLDRNMPAGMYNGNVYHEGEMQAKLPEGELYVNSDTTSQMYPKQFQSGGFATKGTNPFASAVLRSNQLAGGFNNPGSTTTGSTWTPPNSASSYRPTGQIIDSNQTINTQSQFSNGTIKPITSSNQLNSVIPSLTEQISRNIAEYAGPQQVSRETLQTQPMQFQTAQAQAGPQQATAQPTLQSPPQVTTQRPQAQPLQFGTIQERQLQDTPTAAVQPTQEAQARSTGLTYLQDALQGRQGTLLEGQRALDELRLRQAQERSAAEQQAIQAGVDPARARFESQLLRDKQESEANDLASKYGIAGAQEKVNIAGTLASQGLAGQEFEINKRQADVTIQRLQNELGNDTWNSIRDRISGGATLAQINREFPNARLTDTEYRSMYEATPLGERTYERNIGFARTLLEAGGAQNIQSAAKIFNDAFPGTGIDFSKIITADNAATFNTGMSQVSDLVAAGMGYEDAIKVMRNNGTLQMLGITDETQVEGIYRSLKVNAIDEMIKPIMESTTLTSAEKQDLREMAVAIMTGKLDYKFQNEYTVTDQNGNETKMYMDQNAAQSYATNNPGSQVVATGQRKIVPITDILDESEATPQQPQQSNKPQGSIYIENGKIYRVGADKVPQELPMPEDPWTPDADQIIKLGREGNPLYDDLMQVRIDDAVTTPSLDKFKALKDSDEKSYTRAVSLMNKGSVAYKRGVNTKVAGLAGLVYGHSTDNIQTTLREGNTTKITVDGVDIPVKVTVLGKFKNTAGGDNAYMEFQDADGNFYHIGGYKRNEQIVKGKTTHYDHVVGGNQNIA